MTGPAGPVAAGGDGGKAAGPAWAIVLAGGGGTRFGGPKQFADLGGQPMLAHPVRAALAVCDGVVVVLPRAHVGASPADSPAGQWTPPAGVQVVPGGDTRAESVRAGLAAVPADAAVIVVTDAAHPLASAALYRRVVAAVRAGADGAVPGLPLTEVVAGVAAAADEGLVLVAGGSVPKESHRLVQTPHAFRAEALRAAHADGREAVEDSAMVAEAGGRVVVVPGEPANIHVTTPEELAVARLLLPHVAAQAEQAAQPAAAAAPGLAGIR